MRTGCFGIVALALAAGSVQAQAANPTPIEVPLRVEDGRLLVTVEGPDGAEFPFVLGLGRPLLTESGAAHIGGSIQDLTLGGIPVRTEGTTTVPDSYLGPDALVPMGVLGGQTLNRFDILIDVPGGRLLLKPTGRAVRWPGVSLSNPVSLQVYHDVMLRAEVLVDGEVLGGFLELASPALEVNEPLRKATTDGATRLPEFRMGYSGWTDLPVEIGDASLFRGWDPENNGFVVIGAPVAYECAIAISWVHAEMRTCLR